MLKILSKEEVTEIQNITKKLRANIVKMIHNSQSGHPGGSLSAIDILTVLYTKVMKQYPDWDKNPDFENRDRFVLSKGHASAAIYSILAHCGYFPEEDLLQYRKFGTKLQGHPCCTKLKGIEVSTGSLGQGLSIACGMALGLKIDKKNSFVYALMGDGELQEGSIWEAAMNAAHYKLNNLIGIVDRNRLQIDGNTEDVMAVGDVKSKFEAFGWNAIEIDGHNIDAIYEALEKAKESTDKPTVIVANTIKGKGVSFMENQAGWHGKAPNDEQLAQALEELK
ncbi:transketolase [bacterium]|nr:transketolase [bacterium]